MNPALIPHVDIDENAHAVHTNGTPQMYMSHIPTATRIIRFIPPSGEQIEDLVKRVVCNVIVKY